MAEDEFLTREEASELLRKPPATLAAWAYRRIGPDFFRVGRTVLYRRSDLELWLESQRVAPSER